MMQSINVQLDGQFLTPIGIATLHATAPFFCFYCCPTTEQTSPLLGMFLT